MNSFPENPETPPPVATPDAPVPSAAAVESAPPSYPAWNGWDILRILLMLVLGLFLTTVILILVVPGTFQHRLSTLNAHPELQVLAQVVTYFLLLAYMYILVTRERRQPRFWQALRWNLPPGIWRYLLIGFLLQVVFTIAEASRLLRFPKKAPFEELLQRPATVVLISVFAVTLGPLMEELFFRGFLYPLLRRYLNVLWAVIATALPFALMHAAQYGYSYASVLLIFVVGAVLATIREKQNSLAASFLVHIGYNGTIVFGMFLATGGFRHLEKLSHQ